MFLHVAEFCLRHSRINRTSLHRKRARRTNLPASPASLCQEISQTDVARNFKASFCPDGHVAYAKLSPMRSSTVLTCSYLDGEKLYVCGFLHIPLGSRIEIYVKTRVRSHWSLIRRNITNKLYVRFTRCIDATELLYIDAEKRNFSSCKWTSFEHGFGG